MKNLFESGKLERGLWAKAGKNMRKLVKFLSTSNAFFQQLDLKMPHSKSALYRQLINIVYNYMNPKIRPGQPPRPSGRARGRVLPTIGKTIRLSPVKKSSKQQEEEHTETEQSTIHKADKFIPESPEQQKIIQPTSIFDSTVSQKNQEINDQIVDSPHKQDQNDPAMDVRSVDIDTRLAKCASYIDSLYHQYDGCLEHIVDIRESKRYYQQKVKEMDEKLRMKLDKLDEAVLGPLAAEGPKDNDFLQQQIQEDLNNMRRENQRDN